jgi:uncharacterized protein with PIN domain
MMYKTEVEIDRNLRFFTDGKFGTSSIILNNGGCRSIRDLLESIGIPHTETGRILLNGEQASDDEVLCNDCRLKIFPAEPSFTDRFLLDVHLGKLASNLRMLGFDVDYSIDRHDEQLAEIQRRTGRALLTCDRGLLMRGIVGCGMLVRSREPLVQTAEVVCRFCLEEHFNLFSRCINCGGRLIDAVEFDNLPASAAVEIPPGGRSRAERYKICSGCGRPYWEGSHFTGMNDKIDRIIELSALIRNGLS